MGFTNGLRAFGISALAAVSIATVAAPAVAAASPSIATTTATSAARVVHIAEAQRGKRYAYGASGPSAFDCSGLVRYAYRTAGVGSKLGGGHSGYAMYHWAVAHHKLSRTAPQVGDVVVYGRGAHVGIYIGSGRVVSALNPRQGIRITGLHALGQSVTGYIHTHLGKAASGVTSITTVKTPAATHKTAKAKGTVVRARTSVNLRSGSSTSSRVLAVVRPGTAMRMTGHVVRHGVRWDHVTYHGRVAWVRASLVRAG